MKLEDLFFGQEQKLWLRLDTDNIDKLEILQEISIYSDSADTYTLEQGNQGFSVKGKDPKNDEKLNDICRLNPTRIVWIEEIRKKTKEVLVSIRTFSGTLLDLSNFDIAIDDKILTYAQKRNRRNKKVSDVSEWLEKECLLHGNVTYAFLSAGKETDKKENMDSFVLLGRSMRLVIKRTTRSADSAEVYLIDKIISGKPNIDKFPISLVSGNIQFKDYTVAGQAQISAKAELDELIKNESSYLDLWNKFSRLERKILLHEIEKVGSIRYTHWEQEPNELIRFDLSTNESIRLLEEGKQLEISTYIPTEETFKEYIDKLLDESKKKREKVFFGEIKKIIMGSIYIKPNKNIQLLPPENGSFILSMRGDITRLERQNEAWRKIRNAEAQMPHLGLLLEGGKIPIARNNLVPALNAKIKNKIFPKHPPTKKQEEAISIALNTPDIALIQGPPGTGKTTVITAIVERLNEILDTSDGIGGEILITAFQHDAVENAMGRMTVNSLPAIKFGKKSDQDEDAITVTEQKAQDWSDDIVKKIRISLPEVKEYHEIKEIKTLVTGYLLAPVEGQLLKDMLDKVLKLSMKKLSSDLSDRLMNQIDLIQSNTEDIDKNISKMLINAIRGIRTHKLAFEDDGAEMAYIAIRALEKANLKQYINNTLKDASNWFPGDDMGFIDSLSGTKNKILSQIIKTENFQLPKVNKDIAHLLTDIVTHLETQAPKTKTEKILSDFIGELENNPEAIRQVIIAYTAVYGATNQYTASNEMSNFSSSEEHYYDSVIVDEAARSAPLDLLIPMTKAKKRIILVGDHRQLPHIIDSALEKELENELQMNDENVNSKVNKVIKDSLFSHLFNLLKEREEKDGIKRTVTLDSQFRTHPILGEFISDSFYAPYHEGFKSPLGAEFFKHSLERYEDKPCAWINVPISLGSEIPGMSKARKEEAKWIAKELAKLLQDENAKKLNFGIITFYKRQVDLISQELVKLGIMTRTESGAYEPVDKYKELITEDGHREEKLRIGTVDAFQGKEFDVVLLSMVRSNNLPAGSEKELKRKYGHLMSPNRMCVSMSRQKKLLIVVGDLSMLQCEQENNPILPLQKYYELCQSKGIVTDEK